MSFWLGLIIGLVVGAPIGILTAALCVVAAGADHINDHEGNGWGTDD